MRLALIGVGLIGASAAWAMKRGRVFERLPCRLKVRAKQWK